MLLYFSSPFFEKINQYPIDNSRYNQSIASRCRSIFSQKLLFTDRLSIGIGNAEKLCSPLHIDDELQIILIFQCPRTILCNVPTDAQEFSPSIWMILNSTDSANSILFHSEPFTIHLKQVDFRHSSYSLKRVFHRTLCSLFQSFHQH